MKTRDALKFLFPINFYGQIYDMNRNQLSAYKEYVINSLYNILRKNKDYLNLIEASFKMIIDRYEEEIEVWTKSLINDGGR